jgi:hypothetical protein
MTDKIFASGIDGVTGQYETPPLAADELAVRIPKARLSPAQLRELRWWSEHYGVDDPVRSPVHSVNPGDLASAGWGVLFAPDIDRRSRAALEPLLEWRQRLAGPHFRIFEYRQGQGKRDFLAMHGAPPGPADPIHVPYYLLIVGSPQAIPFEFQLDLDIQYAVGRICFECPEDYSQYARSVVRAETSPPRKARRFVFFGPDHANDPATRASRHHLIDPLARISQEVLHPWRVDHLTGSLATKERLLELLGGAEAPALLFTAGHGLAFSAEDPRQAEEQGALLCADWPGPGAWEGPILDQHCFSARDVGRAADLCGLIVFQLASFGGGTPERDSLSESGEPARLAPHPLVAQLPQRLLSHSEGGALAFVSPIDRLWTSSFGEGQVVLVLASVLRRLLSRLPLGSAMELVNQQHAELSVRLSSAWWEREARGDALAVARWWRAYSMARSLTIFGDPAVRLSYRED